MTRHDPTPQPCSFRDRHETVTTDELRVGDVVLTHGARCRIFQIDEYYTAGRPVFACLSHVLNPDDGADAWIVHWEQLDGYWNIQGNSLARWCREIRA
jgi:hypothetical protein